MAGKSILIYSHVYWPNYGGSGQVARRISRGLVELGYKVAIVTETPLSTDSVTSHALDDPVAEPRTDVIRGFGFRDFASRAARAASVILIGPSRKALPAALLVNRSVLVTHHMMPDVRSRTGVMSVAVRLARHVGCSSAVSRRVGHGCETVPNPYDETTFGLAPPDQRRNDLIFVGRVIPEKGLHVLLAAIELLAMRGLRLRLTVAGDGTALGDSRDLARRLGIERQVRFLGAVTQDELATLLRSHRVLVAPSLCEEAFGLSVTEALACGCRPVVTDRGGLPEAAGGFGQVAHADDAASLAGAIEAARDQGPITDGPERAALETFLERHTCRAAASGYLSALGLEAADGRS